MKKILIVLFLILNFMPEAQAITLPSQLAEWVPWVKRDVSQADCPLITNDKKACTWSSFLYLDLHSQGGSFKQEWEVFEPSFVSLPGSETNPPLEVGSNGAPLAYIMRGGVPQTYLEKGRYKIEGQFRWKGLPDNLPVDPAIGLFSLILEGVPMPQAKREKDGAIWLKGQPQNTPEEESFGLEVFRKLEDGVPLKLTTLLKLKVAGVNREIHLESFLPQDFIPLTLESPLPTKLEPDGSLSLQLKAGEFTVEVAARLKGNIETLAVPSLNAPWPQEEIWVWVPAPAIRQVDVAGLSAIDPQQTNLPANWRNWAAYLALPGHSFSLTEKIRGLSYAQADELTLNRELWLDFDGKGLSIKDHIVGTMNQGFRLNAHPNFGNPTLGNSQMKLGRLSVDGEATLITQATGNREGIEIRNKNLNVEADSRLTGSLLGMPVSGWAQDFQEVNARFHLPPGWRLLWARGVDLAQPSWVSQWTLLDFFLVLIVVIAIFKLLGIKAALLSFFTLVLTYHEKSAPDSFWLVLLVFVALACYVRLDSAWGRWVLFGKRLCLGILVLWLVPFAVSQVKLGLYPVLDHYSFDEPDYDNDAFAFGQEKKMAEEQSMNLPREGAPSIASAPNKQSLSVMKASSYNAQAQQNFARPDPNAKVQTGMGLASWDWNDVRLDWSGPVSKESKMSLILLCPTLNLILAFLRVILAFLLWAVLSGLDLSFLKPKGKVLGLILMVGILGFSTQVRAEFPTPELLEALQTYVTQDPACAPHCTEIESATILATTDTLTLTLKVNSLALSAVALPHSADWEPSSILVDGVEAHLTTDDTAINWVVVTPGVHHLVLKGNVQTNQVALSFQMPPKKTTIELNGWLVAGLNEKGAPIETLELTRNQALPVSGDQISTQTLPPFVRLERELYFGLEWEIITRVVREGKSGSPIVLEYPLLEGEYITEQSPTVTAGKARLVMGPQEEELTWNSRINPKENLRLTALDSTQWVEVWKIFSSTLWHVEATGINPISRASTAGELYEFKPWPGESLDLNMTKPQAVPGPTLTVERATLEFSPGTRITDGVLTLNLRSSLAQNHQIQLPVASEMKSLTINGTEEPLVFDKGQLRLSVKAGEQNVVIKWREKLVLGSLFKMPTLDLGLPAVNLSTSVLFPTNRWIFMTGGKGYGAVMLFWSYLVVILLMGMVLTQMPNNFLKLHEWILLGLGLTQVSVWAATILVIWFLAVGYRKKYAVQSSFLFDLIQMGLVLLTLCAFGVLLSAIQGGLLGFPQMQIAGNGSTAHHLKWFVDHSTNQWPSFWVLSCSLWVYRVLMFVWSLWLAKACIRWIRFGWQAFKQGGSWKVIRSIVRSAK